MVSNTGSLFNIFNHPFSIGIFSTKKPSSDLGDPPFLWWVLRQETVDLGDNVRQLPVKQLKKIPETWPHLCGLASPYRDHGTWLSLLSYVIVYILKYREALWPPRCFYFWVNFRDLTVTLRFYILGIIPKKNLQVRVFELMWIIQNCCILNGVINQLRRGNCTTLHEWMLQIDASCLYLS